MQNLAEGIGLSCGPEHRRTEGRVAQIIAHAHAPTKPKKTEPYVKVPFALIRSDLSNNAKVLWQIIGTIADFATRSTDIKAEKLQEAFGRHRNATARAQKELEDAGWLRVETLQKGGKWIGRLLILENGPKAKKNPLHRFRCNRAEPMKMRVPTAAPFTEPPKTVQ